jgi:ammonia channel protein AmtB
MSAKVLKISLIVFLTSCIFFLGWIRTDYILDFYGNSNGVLSKRHHALKEGYPMDLDSFSQSLHKDGRWLSTIVYSLLFFFLTSILIHVIFRNKKYFKVTVIVYVAISFFILLLVCASFLTGSYSAGYALAQNLKNLIQSPFLSLFLVAVFLWLKKQADNSASFKK